MQQNFATLGAKIQEVQQRAEFPMNIGVYNKSLDAVEKLRDGYTKLVDGQKKVHYGFNNMMQATGQFDVQTVKITDSTTAFTRALKDNKVGLGEVMGNLSRFRQNLKDATTAQTALQKAAVMQWKSNGPGANTADIYIPKNLSSGLTDARTKYGMIGYAVNSIGTATQNWGKNTQWAGRQITAGLSMPIVLAGAQLTKLAMDTDKQLTQIAKVYNTTSHSNMDAAQQQVATEQELAQVRDQSLKNSIQLAQTYGAKISDTLQVESQLAALGKTGTDLYGATAQVVRIATLGDLDYNTALQMTLTLMNAFHENGSQLADTFNFINAAENATSLTTKDIAEALPRVGATMASLGMNVQETTVLLTAFKEGGVEATQGANALKTAVARAFDPVPKAVKEFQAFGIDIKSVVHDSGGDFLKFMEDLSQKMAGMKPMDKLVALKDLFGIQQSNRLLTVINNLGQAFGKDGKIPAGVSQTATAIKLMKEGTDAWAQTANQEVAQFQNSASGKFKIAIASIQASLIQLGQPLLQALTPVMNFVGKLIDGFNGLPSIVKKAVAVFAVIGAIAGPVIMLTGLLGNLFGSGIKILGSLFQISRNFRPLTAEQVAMQKAADLAKKAITNEGDALDLLGRKMGELNVIMKAQVDAQLALIEGAEKAAGAQAKLADVNGRAAAGQVAGNVAAATQAASTTAEVNPPVVTSSESSSSESATASKESAAATISQVEQGNEQVVQAVDRSAESSTVLAHLDKISEKLKENIKGAAEESAHMESSAAATGASFSHVASHIGTMAVGAYFLHDMFTSSGGFADHMITGGMAVTLMAPTLGAIIKMLKQASIGEGIVGILGGVQGKFTGFFTKIASGLTGVKTKLVSTFSENGIKGIFTMLTSGALGFTLLAAAIGGTAVAMYALHEHVTQLTRDQEALNKSSDAFAGVLGAQRKADMAGAAQSDNTITAYAARAQLLDKLSSQYKDLTDALSRAKNMDEAYAAASNIALRFKADTNATDTQVREAFETAMQGAGATPADIKKYDVKFDSIKLDDPQAVADALVSQVQAAVDNAGKNLDPRGFWNNFGSIFRGGDSVISDMATASMDKAGATVASAVQAAGDNMSEKYNIGQQLTGFMGDAFNKTFQHTVLAADPKVKAIAKQMGLTDMQSFMDAYTTAINAVNDGKATAAQKNFVNVMAGVELNGTGSGDALQHVTKQYQDAFKHMRDAVIVNMGYAAGSPGFKKMQQQIQTMPDLLRAMGIPLKEVAADTDNLGNSSGGAAQKIESLTDAYNRLANVDPSKAVGTADQYVNMIKSSYSGAIQYATARASELFGRAQQADQQAIQNAGEASQAALQKQQKIKDAAYDEQTKKAQAAGDAETKAIELKYKKLGDHYDKEIKQAQDAAKKKTGAIQKAIDALGKEDAARQKLFDNERTRLQRMAQLANNNIDFNQALNSGNLDAAAKVYNNNQATVQGYIMDDQQQAMDDASKKKQDALQKQLDGINNHTQAYVDGVQKQKDALSDLQTKEEDLAKARNQALQDRISKEKAAYDDGMQASMQADQKKTQNNLQANQTMWQDKQDKLNMEIAAITANVPRTKKQEQDQITAIEGVYKKYGVDLQGYGAEWGGYVGDALTYSIQQAAASLQSDIAWSQIGDFITQKLTDQKWTIDQVVQFLKTGVWPDNSKNKPTPAKPWQPPNVQSNAAHHGAGAFVGRPQDPSGAGGGGVFAKHQGGFTHSGRAGYPVNAPMFSSEYLTLMEQGEFVVNKRSAAQHRPLLEAINSGALPVEAHHSGGPVGGLVNALITKTMLTQAAGMMLAAQMAIAGASGGTPYVPGGGGDGGGGGIYGAAPTSVSGNQAIVKAMAASKYNWTGREWDALYWILMHESGFRNTAKNPTSSAYGMFQFLDTTWAGYGVGKTSDPTLQTLAGLRYIKARYHDPIGAQRFWAANHYYDQGGYLMPGEIGLNGTGKPEPVFTEKQWEIMSNLVANTTSMAGEMVGAAGANVASGSNTQYNVKVDMTGCTFAKEIDVEKAVYNALVKMDAKNGRSRTVN